MKRRAAVTALMLAGAMLGAAAQAASLPDTIAKLKPSVVVVGTFRPTDSPRFQLRGTGFVVGNGQHVITNAHVLPEDPTGANAQALVVQIRRSGSDGWDTRLVTLVGTDGPRDLALLRLDGAPATPLVVGDSSRVREGDALAFMGFPIGGLLGYSTVTHRAMVSSITAAQLPSPTADRLREQAIRSLRSGPFDIFQLDATAYPGNSGGPLFDPATGEVLGVMNMVLIKSTRESALSQPSGISYAIPSRYVLELMERHK